MSISPTLISNLIIFRSKSIPFGLKPTSKDFPKKKIIAYSTACIVKPFKHCSYEYTTYSLNLAFSFTQCE